MRVRNSHVPNQPMYGDGSELVEAAQPTRQPPQEEELSYEFIEFSMVMQTQFGEELCITGSAPELGSWNPNVGIKLQWSQGHKWFVRIPFKTFASKSFEYKYVIKNNSGSQKWEGGQNHFFDLKHFSDMLQSPQVQDFLRV